MPKVFLLLIFTLISQQAVAEPTIYYCNMFTRLPGAPESPIFRFEVDSGNAWLSYNFRARPAEPPQQFKLRLQVLNDSERSLVLGMLTEGNDEVAPRYDVWVLDKRNMQLSSEVTHATDTNMSRLQQRSGTCIIEK